MKHIALIAILPILLSLSGCGGGGAELKTSNSTMGQELLDLDKAHKAGIISDREYKKSKKRILKGEY